MSLVTLISYTIVSRAGNLIVAKEGVTFPEWCRQSDDPEAIKGLRVSTNKEFP